MIFGILAASISGFMIISDAPFWDAVYMTVITISTVGYEEVVQLDANGRIFTSILIITNIGIFAYAVSIITSFIMEGNVQRLIKDYRVYQKIRNLENHVIVCGYGRHGFEVTSELVKQKIPFVIIEKEEEKIDELRENGEFLYIDGDATHDDILEEAGIERAASLIATLGEDADNVFVVLSARQLNPKLRIISRAFNQKAEAKLMRAGADHVVQPERIGGFYMATMAQKPDVVEFMTLLSNMGSAQIVFEEFEAREMREEYRGKTIREVNFRGLTGANIIGIHDEKGYYIINPTPDTLIRNGAKVVVLGNQKQMKDFKNLILKNKNP
jgi:voltage-gated potassium channel